ncbi:hypothetical protein BDV97DRAFT_58263 [Delphinella strobiligena]|nr:hypothetical protein BDV97DRAFT_58263 [Delphinella strobiligena]
MTLYKTLWSGAGLPPGTSRTIHLCYYMSLLTLYAGAPTSGSFWQRFGSSTAVAYLVLWKAANATRALSCFIGVLLECGPCSLLVALPATNAHVTHSYHNDDSTASAR